MSIKLFNRNEKFHMEEGMAAFIIPFWSEGKTERIEELEQAIGSIMCQSDEKFHIYIVDDNSPDLEVRKNLVRIEQSNPKITVIFANENKGPGAARNLGINQAYRDHCPFICFLDSDDLSHPNRVEEARKKFLEQEEIDVVYSTFQVVDEENKPVMQEKLVEGIRVTLKDLANRPLYGYDTWKSIATERDALTIPSALNVRTELAYAVPFPEHVRFHEDTYTWLRYAGAGGNVFYLDSIPSRYRIKQNARGSESRERAGGIEEFNRIRCRVIMQGLEFAMDDAKRRGQVEDKQMDDYKIKFLLNVAAIISKEGTLNVVEELINWAKSISSEKYELYCEQYHIQ